VNKQHIRKSVDINFEKKKCSLAERENAFISEAEGESCNSWVDQIVQKYCQLDHFLQYS